MKRNGTKQAFGGESPQYQGLMLCGGVIYLVVSLADLFYHPAPWAAAGSVVVSMLALFPTVQFARRLWWPVQAAAQTAALAEGRKTVLRRLQYGSLIFGGSILVAHGMMHLARGVRGGEWYLSWYLLSFLVPAALRDLVGDPAQPSPRETFGPRIDWGLAAPLHSDHWGARG